MDKDGVKRTRAKRWSDGTSEVDRLSNLPESLLLEILLNLPTKDAVRSSVLSSRWRNIWRYVPRLDLEMMGDSKYDAYVSFVDRFLDFNSEVCIQSLRLRYKPFASYERDRAHVTSWINNVAERKIQHLKVLDYTWRYSEIQIPPTIYKCHNLVSLKLYSVKLADTEVVNLPSLREIDMNVVKFANSLDFEKLISGCPVLESLTINRDASDNVDVLRVCSKSLLSFTHISNGVIVVDQSVVVDAPKVKYLRLNDIETVRFVRSNPPYIVKVDISIKSNCFEKGVDPNDLQKRQMVRNFLNLIARAQDMILLSRAIEDMYIYLMEEPLPQFRNVFNLHARFLNFRFKDFPTFLQSFANLKSLVLCFISSLEFVELEDPILGNSMEMKLVSYFLENSTKLKKLTLRVDGSIRGESVILKELNVIPRLSSTCKVVVISCLSFLSDLPIPRT